MSGLGVHQSPLFTPGAVQTFILRWAVAGASCRERHPGPGEQRLDGQIEKRKM